MQPAKHKITTFKQIVEIIPAYLVSPASMAKDLFYEVLHHLTTYFFAVQ